MHSRNKRVKENRKSVLLTKIIKNFVSNILCESLQVSVRAPLPSGSEYSLELDLSHPIVPEQSSFRVVPSKVRLMLSTLIY